MQTRFLNTFLVVARTRSITRAADAVHLAQSSVSDQVQALETELGVELFIRTRHGLHLSPAGNIFKPYAEQILALAQDADAATGQMAKRVDAPLVIGALETIGAAKLPQWLSCFQQHQPDINLTVKIAGSGQLMQGVLDGTLDAAFCFDKGANDARLVRRVVSSEPLVYIGSPANAATPEPWGPDALAKYRFIVTERGCVYRHMADQAFSDAGMGPLANVLEVDSIAAIGRLVSAGAGRAFVPRFAVNEMIDCGGVTELPWLRDIGTASLILVWRRRRVQRPALTQFLVAANEWVDGAKSVDVRPPHAALCRL